MTKMCGVFTEGGQVTSTTKWMGGGSGEGSGNYCVKSPCLDTSDYCVPLACRCCINICVSEEAQDRHRQVAVFVELVYLVHCPLAWVHQVKDKWVSLLPSGQKRRILS